MSETIDWDAEKLLSVSNATLVVLHDLIGDMAKHEYQNSSVLTEAQQHAFDELCAACEPKNDAVFSQNYDQLLRCAEDHLNRRFEQ